MSSSRKNETNHDALPAISAVMQLFVLPLTAITLLVLLLRERGRKRAG